MTPKYLGPLFWINTTLVAVNGVLITVGLRMGTPVGWNVFALVLCSLAAVANYLQMPKE